MLLREAKEILKRKGYKLFKENKELTIKEMADEILRVLDEYEDWLTNLNDELMTYLYDSEFSEYCAEYRLDPDDVDSWEAFISGNKTNEEMMNDILNSNKIKDKYAVIKELYRRLKLNY